MKLYIESENYIYEQFNDIPLDINTLEKNKK